MVSKSKIRRQVKQIIDGLSEKVIPAGRPGPVIRDKSYKMSPKDRRHSGRKTPRWTRGGKMKYQKAIEEGLEPQDFWDDWFDWRDGRRNTFNDCSRFKKADIKEFYYRNDYRFVSNSKPWYSPSRINKKLMKELMVRRAAKEKYENLKHSKVYKIDMS